MKSRSQNDSAIKCLFALQIIWHLVQTFLRMILHYQITLFEAMTIGFVFCSLATIGFSLNRPQNVDYPVLLGIKPESEPEAPVCDVGPAKEAGRAAHTRVESQGPENSVPGNIPRRPSFRFTFTAKCISLVLLYLFACGFGAIHCLAWNSPFPTTKERLAWRISAIATIVVPDFILNYIFWRLGIILLALIAFRALPADAFETVQWNQYIPHFL